MFVVLDTNHFREVAEATALANAEVFLSIITIQEATGGWLALIHSTHAGRDQITGYTSFQKTVTAFQKFDIPPFDHEAADTFHRLKSVQPRTGTMDLKIAAICLAHDATLLTRNLRDFQNIPACALKTGWIKTAHLADFSIT